MVQVSLDTSFLISFADPARKNHAVAVEYFRHCVATNIPLWISTVAAGEFHVKQPFTDLPLKNFRIQPYNLPHAIRAGDMFNFLRTANPSEQSEPRRIIINDIKILAQAIEDKISIILSEDEGTLFRLAQRARHMSAEAPSVLLLTQGFTPGRLIDPDQDELSL
jgi:hypothetical protein